MTIKLVFSLDPSHYQAAIEIKLDALQKIADGARLRLMLTRAVRMAIRNSNHDGASLYFSAFLVDKTKICHCKLYDVSNIKAVKGAVSDMERIVSELAK